MMLDNKNVMQSKKPNFFIVGTAKGGTTSIYHYLSHHPDVYMSPIKEPHYFSKDIRCKDFGPDYKKTTCFDLNEYFSRDVLESRHAANIEREEHYLKLFNDVADQKAIGESSVGYLYSEVAAPEIKKTIPEAKIIIMLRNPIERAFSHWLMDLGGGIAESKNFYESFISDKNSTQKGWGRSHLYLELGLYYEQVKRYLDTFGHTNVKIILFDDFKINPKNIVKDLYQFLNLEYLSTNTDEIHNKTKLAKFPIVHKMIGIIGLNKILLKLLPSDIVSKIKSRLYSDKNIPKLTHEDRQKLLGYFEEDIKKLSLLIDRDLSNWLKVRS